MKQEFESTDSFSRVTTDHWIETCNFTGEELLSRYVTQGSLVDGLFLWLTTIAFKTHLNYVHSSNVWTSRGSEQPNMRDAVILFTQKYFIAAPSVNEQSLKAIVKDGFCDPVDTVVKFVDVLLVLN